MALEQLNIEVVPGEAMVAVSVAGEIDLGNVSQLRTALSDASATGSDVVLELSGVSFVDSMALGVVVQAKRNLEHHGRRLIVRNPTPVVRRVFTVAGVDDYLFD